MKPVESIEVEIQREYYKNTAKQYDEWHLCSQDDHYFALSYLAGMIDFFNISSILDVGAGTGRAISYLKQVRPNIKVVGVEPVKELREIGYRKGLSIEELRGGNAIELPFKDGEFDLVCEFGVLHHIRDHSKAVKEFLRVSKTAIFISDSNNFGQGSIVKRTIKQILNNFGLWNAVDYLKTGGKYYSISEGDGLAYSYSVFMDYKLIKQYCKKVHIINTSGIGINPYKSASHVALLGVKSV